MGFNKVILPTKHELQQMVYDYGVEYVLKLYRKADALIGPSDSMDYLHSLNNTINYNKK